MPTLFVFPVFTHQFCQSVDVDLSLLQSSTEEHGRCHQKVVRDAVSVNIHGRNFAAIIGANLKVTKTHAFKNGQIISTDLSDLIGRNLCYFRCSLFRFGDIWVIWSAF